MKHQLRKVMAATSMMMVALLLTTTAGTAYETGAIDPPVHPVVITFRPDSARDSAKSFWTPQARSLAQPRTFPEEPVSETSLAAPRAAPTDRAPVYAPGSAPQPGAGAQARRDFPEEWRPAANHKELVEGRIDSRDDEHSFPPHTAAYTAFNGNEHSQMWQSYPYNAVGKLYFNTPAGPAYCTASVIGPDTILTAAQCVFDIAADNAFTDFAFCPAARGTSCPYGVFPWTDAFLLADFAQAEIWQIAHGVDVALLRLNSNQTGERVHTYTGWLGVVWDLPPERHVFAIGYPVTKSDEGFSQICIDQTFEVAVGIQKMGCDSGMGHLGGPWIVNFAPYITEGANFIHGVTGFQYTRGRNEIGGPRLTMDNIGGLCEVVPGC